MSHISHVVIKRRTRWASSIKPHCRPVTRRLHTTFQGWITPVNPSIILSKAIFHHRRFNSQQEAANGSALNSVAWFEQRDNKSRNADTIWHDLWVIMKRNSYGSLVNSAAMLRQRDGRLGFRALRFSGERRRGLLSRQQTGTLRDQSQARQGERGGESVVGRKCLWNDHELTYTKAAGKKMPHRWDFLARQWSVR